MAKKITELTDGGALQTGDILAGVRAGVTNKVVPGTAATRAVGLAATNVLQADQTEASTATATTVALGVATLRHLLTGTTTVTGFTGTAGVMYTCRANAAFLLTHNATDLIITQTGASITTAAGDTFDVIMITGTTCRIVNYVPATGKPYGRKDILGTVSKTGDYAVDGDGYITGMGTLVPTGAIIERGSNANGEYVRYADGTQMCFAFFVGYTGGENVDVTLPATVVNPGDVVVSASVFPASGYDFSYTAYRSGTDSAVFRSTSTHSTNQVRLVAIGRWF